MELQISRHIHSEVSAEAVVWGGETKFRGGVSPIGGAEAEPDRGRAFEAGSRAHVDQHSAEVGGVECGWLSERKECDPHSAALPEAGEELCWAAFLGAWILCGYGGSEGGSDPEVYSGTGRRRPTVGSA